MKASTRHQSRPQQLQINWTLPPDVPAVSHLKDGQLPEQVEVADFSKSSLVLPWDFQTTFPKPLPRAIATGIINEDDANPENLASVHQEHAREMLAILSDLDTLKEAQQTGIDPRTGKRPGSPKAKQSLQKHLGDATSRLQNASDALLEVYQAAFGWDAANAFWRAIHAWHAGRKVLNEHREEPPKSADSSENCHADISATKPAGTSFTDTPAPAAAQSASDPTEECADHCFNPVGQPDIPIAPPREEAVARGVFGEDENGFVEPSPEEIEAITVHHGEKLVKALEDLQEWKASIGPAKLHDTEQVAQKERLMCAYQGALALYAEDFGEAPARRLDNWARAHVESEPPEGCQYDLGHPWHYYDEGDAAQPIPVEQIQPAFESENYSFSLPKNPRKRRKRIDTLLDSQSEQLENDKRRYQQLIERGVDGLSDYDRQIAHGGNDRLGWASAVALKYNHIRFGLARIAWLQSQDKNDAKP